MEKAQMATETKAAFDRVHDHLWHAAQDNLAAEGYKHHNVLVEHIMRDFRDSLFGPKADDEMQYTYNYHLQMMRRIEQSPRGQKYPEVAYTRLLEAYSDVGRRLFS